MTAQWALPTMHTQSPAVARTSLRWFHRWSPILEQAIDHLPASDACPRPLYSRLLAERCSPDNPVALVARRGDPIAVIGLQRAGTKWDLQTNWLLPGFLLAARTEDTVGAIARLNRTVHVRWWRMGSPPQHRSVLRSTAVPVHESRVADREAYWRRGRQWRNVTAARRKCADLTLSVNRPGDAEWVIRSWADKRLAPPDASSAVASRLLVARELEPLGRHHTLVLRDGDRPVAGATTLVHGDALVAGVLCRDESVGNLPTGVRIIDATFDHADLIGATWFDLGGGHAYKERWAPANGARHDLVVGSPLSVAKARVMRLAGR